MHNLKLTFIQLAMCTYNDVLASNVVRSSIGATTICIAPTQCGQSLNNLCEVEKKHLLLAYIMGMRMCRPSTQYKRVGNQ